MLTAVDNYSKWVWTKVVISGSTKNRIKLLEGITELNGVPKSLMVDNSSAFESTELKNFLAESEKCVKYSTPYVYTPIELVERTIRTIEEYIKTFPVEENVLKKAVKRATRVTRFSWSAGTKRTAFHLFFNSKRGAKLINTITSYKMSTTPKEPLDTDPLYIEPSPRHGKRENNRTNRQNRRAAVGN